MPDLPSGTVTFLFTDIEGSTRLWERDPAAMWATVHRHNDLLGAAIAAQGGHHFKTIGDAYQAAFPNVPAAVAAVADAQRALAEEPWPETGPIRVRMALHLGEAAPLNGDYLAPCLNRLARLLSTGYGGQVLLTDLARREAERALPAGVTLRGLGRHRLRDLLDPEEVWQLDIAGLPATFPPLKSLETHPTNLPAQPNALVGREADLAALLPLVTDPATRLLTLTGPGGTGKTRLSLQLAADAIDAFPDGAFFAGMADVSDPSRFLPEIAAVLGLRESGGLSLAEALKGWLATKRLLLVVDNLEQFQPQSAVARQVSDLLGAAPGLTMVVTSRSPLRAQSEREWPVPPLATPDTRRRRAAADLAEVPAVRLFVERAMAAKPQFALTDDNAEAVATLCARLDGLPLAIELAAARLRVMSPADMLARLGSRLDLLGGRGGDRPDRHQTIRATIDWSHTMLGEEDQALFRHLSVFAGGCSLEAAEAVAVALGAEPWGVLDGLAMLAEQSLIRAEEDGAGRTRYRMLESLRAYAAEKLAAAGTTDAARAAHADVYAALTAEVSAATDQTAHFDRVDPDLENVRAALDWLAEQQAWDRALQVSTDLRWYWWMRGHLREGLDRIGQALAQAPGAPPDTHGRALSGLGALAEALGDDDAAEGHYRAVVDHARAHGDEEMLAAAMDNLGAIAALRGDTATALRHHGEALAVWQARGNQQRMAETLNNLGLAEEAAGDFAEAEGHYRAALEAARAHGSAWMVAATTGNLGGVLRLRTRPTRSSGDPAEQEAWHLLGTALAAWAEFEDVGGIVDTLVAIADLGRVADPARAARLIGAAEAMAEASGHAMAPYDAEGYAALKADLAAATGPDAFRDATVAGARLSAQEAVDAALDWARAHPAGG